MKLALVMATTVLVAVACSSETPIATVNLSVAGQPDFTATVYDHTGLVSMVKNIPFDPADVHDQDVVLSADGMTLEVYWDEGIRHRQPPVVFSPDGSGYVVDVNTDGGGDIFSFVGPSTDDDYPVGLRFQLARPVPQDSVRLHVHGDFN